ncbi:MSHA biogenesis protein MshP [Natronospira proteinivora]|uniref:MSHA biogenesis protein MshP n=1 Tax=Natronospira proteinivora TaxID=1807133 RepID=A0ABT1G9T6_9GAMM|nr:hypothetical protein [Natronospira proteinivora]MCP1728084.1 MSHA biogenesis protein MshP [Natronospira proteinivora]
MMVQQRKAVARGGAEAQRGVALIAALFLLVALGALAVYLVTISGVQQQTPTLSADAARAYYVARGAAEAAGFQASENNACPASFPDSLNDFDLEMTCQQVSSHQEAGDTFSIYRITTTASRGTYGSGNFVSRSVEKTAISQ